MSGAGADAASAVGRTGEFGLGAVPSSFLQAKARRKVRRTVSESVAIFMGHASDVQERVRSRRQRATTLFVLLRLLLHPIVLLFRLLLAPLRAFRRARAAPRGGLLEIGI